MTQPTTQAIQQAQDLIEANIVMGDIDDDTAVINTAGLISDVTDLFALSVSASEREALEQIAALPGEMVIGVAQDIARAALNGAKHP